MIEIVPAILTNSPDEFKKMMHSVESRFLSVHLDIADGIFFPNTTIKGPNELGKIHSRLKIIVHLMVSEPENILEQWLNTEVKALIFHIESTKRMDKLISDTRAKGKKVGIAINPDTSVEGLVPFIENVDFVHFMTVDPGFYGSEFREDVLDKIKTFRKKYDKIEIRVDGGINTSTAKKIVEAGANVLVAGSYFFKNGRNIDEALENIKRII